MKEMNQIAKTYAEEKLANLISWRGNSLQQIYDIKDELYDPARKEEEEFQTLEKLKEFPNYVAGDITWRRINMGVLAQESIRDQVEKFYQEEYSDFLQELKKRPHESEKPILLVGTCEDLEENVVYPLIAKYKGYTDCIVLLINEKEA